MTLSGTLRAPWTRGVCVITFVWAATCALFFRVPYAGEVGPQDIADERGFYTQLAGPNPITVEDYRETSLVRRGLWARDLGSRDRVLVIEGKRLPLADSIPMSTRLVVTTGNIGLIGYVAGSSVHVVDRHGLSDPIASRLQLPKRGRPGHEKDLPSAWIAARFADPQAATAAYPDSSAAIDALRCGDVAALLRAIQEPLTPGRFLENLRLAWALRALRIPPEPAAARAEACA